MKANKFTWTITVLIVAIAMISSIGCTQGITAPPTTPTTVPTKTQTLVPTTEPVASLVPTQTIVPTNPPATVQIVVTTTGSGLQVPWTPVAFTPIATQTIDWDHLKLMGDWVEGQGLAPNVTVLYVQSGTPNHLTLPSSPFTIPANQHLVFGAFKAKLTIADGSMMGTYEFSNGFYAAIPGGTTISELTVTDGFAALVLDKDALNEFCYRVAQAYAEGWAHDHVYHSPLWQAPVCNGIYSVPLDSDR